MVEAGALLDRLPPREFVVSRSLQLTVGDKLEHGAMIRTLTEHGYLRVEQVAEPGEFAVRGAVLDVFATGGVQPVRIDLFDDEIESLRMFDAQTQLSSGKTDALRRYHGVFAAASAWRAAITPAGRGRGARHKAALQPSSERPVSKHAALTWMQRLKRVFAIEIERCYRCGGRLEVIASSEEPALIERILARVRPAGEDEESAPFAARAPPQPRLL